MKKILWQFIMIYLFIWFIPSIVLAANLYFDSSKDTFSVGDSFVVNVKIDSPEISINSAEAEIRLENNDGILEIKDLNVAKSIFSLWPKAPIVSNDNKIISFVGGVPGGVKPNKADLFNIVFEAKKAGEIKINPNNLSIYANDGKGTVISVSSQILTLKVLPKNNSNPTSNEWSTIISSDKTNPETFSIEIGKDSSLYDGKKFAFFTAVDNQSGISHYDISEDGYITTQNENIYILKNQNDNQKPNLKVTAYDKAGNKTTSIYNKYRNYAFGFSISCIIILIIIIVFLIIYKRIKSKKNYVSKK